MQLSDAFKAALSPHFQEGQRAELLLPEDDDRAVELLVGYAYSTVSLVNQGRKFLPPDQLVGLRDYLSLYVLAHKYLIHDVQDAAIAAVYGHYFYPRRKIDPNDVQYVYEHLPEESQMRRLFLALVVREITTESRGTPISPEWKWAMMKNSDIFRDAFLCMQGIAGKGEKLLNLVLQPLTCFYVNGSDKSCVVRSTTD